MWNPQGVVSGRAWSVLLAQGGSRGNIRCSNPFALLDLWRELSRSSHKLCLTTMCAHMLIVGNLAGNISIKWLALVPSLSSIQLVLLLSSAIQ